jgi:hypothetical protein
VVKAWPEALPFLGGTKNSVVMAQLETQFILYKEFRSNGKSQNLLYQQMILWALKITNEMVSVNVLFGVNGTVGGTAAFWPNQEFFG